MTNITNQEHESVLNAKELLHQRTKVISQVGEMRAFDFMSKLATVANLKILQDIKDRKEYSGLTYENDDGELATVSNWEEFCTHILRKSKRTIDDKLLNLKTFGADFFEVAQQIGLGSRDLANLRKLDDDSQALLVDPDAVDLSDPDDVKAHIDEINAKAQSREKKLKEELQDAQQALNAKTKMLSGANAELEKALNQCEKLENTNKNERQMRPWREVIAEYNLKATTLATHILQLVEELENLNFDIQAEEMDGDHSDAALRVMADVQIHCVDRVFVATNDLSINTRETFPHFIDTARPMYTEQDIAALVEQIEERG